VHHGRRAHGGNGQAVGRAAPLHRMMPPSVSCGMSHHRPPFHSTAVWQRTRRIAKITAAYTCARCNAFLPGKGELHVHHRKPVSKSMALALEPLNLMPVCPGCHNIIEPRAGSPRVKSGCDELGHPLSADHPWNNGSSASNARRPGQNAPANLNSVSHNGATADIVTRGVNSSRSRGDPQ
jgi:hypothetical protein